MACPPTSSSRPTPARPSATSRKPSRASTASRRARRRRGAAKRNGHLLLAEAETSTWGSSWPLVADVRNGRRGLVLQPDHLDGDALFRTPFPRMARAEFPVGRGVYVESGRLRRVQIPVAD
ncbi:hypothetical protein Cch01nite_14530 [Cellulomonas chitinilytica]|uniref:Uncharacterized protein n=1 Tax=Cellulomonas chitinilytica TaxID=398759 RepID=A0A919P457_9CELL|nr:hypothetical protein [Cellulomonas chitinilytica]GIG20729.1 hypothetical protein Cch01nite_14530 [Cellulomonas chitinilytica]